MHEITTKEIGYFAIVWFVACAAAISRIARDGESISCWNLVGSGFTSGFYGFGIVALFFVPNTSSSDSHWYWIGVSALVGLLGKEQDTIAKTLVAKVFAVAKLLKEQRD